jgi:hypothetical protein
LDRRAPPLGLFGSVALDDAAALLEEPQQQLAAGAHLRPAIGGCVERGSDFGGLGDHQPWAGGRHDTSVAPIW